MDERVKKPEEKLDEGLEAAKAEMKADNINDPWLLADKAGKTLDTPMDSKTIKNAILKRLPEVRRIQLVKKGELGAMNIVLVCELPHETAILVEDNANIFMRHKELMNIVDNMYLELRSRKRLRKTNKLPADFFRSERQIAFADHK